MNQIESRFNAAFANWGIRLPPGDIAARRRGKINKAGWAIWYLFGSDETGEYLDYYSSHRMTNDGHTRLYADGREEGLPVLSGMRLASSDPAEDARLKEEYQAECLRVERLLREKGFGIEGDEPPSVQIIRAQILGQAGRAPDGTDAQGEGEGETRC